MTSPRHRDYIKARTAWRIPHLQVAAWLAVALFGCLASACQPGARTPEIRSDNATALYESLPAPEWTASDWPQWRGPTSDGASAGPPLPTHWGRDTNPVRGTTAVSDDSPRSTNSGDGDSDCVAWRTKIPGRGHSSPIVIGERVFLATCEEARETQSVLAISATTGELLRQTDLLQGPLEFNLHAENTHASSTLASDGERLFATFLNDRRIWVVALDLEGVEQWRTEVGEFASTWGYSASPAVHRSFVFIAADHSLGGFLAALHRQTGQIAWRANRDAVSSYSSPRIIRTGERDLVVLTGGNRMAAYDAPTGELVWSTAGTADATVTTVVQCGDVLVGSGGYPGRETLAVRLDGSPAWRMRDASYVPSLIVHREHVYMVDDEGVASCHDGVTGRTRWKKRLGGKFRASPIVHHDLAYLTNVAGATFVVRLSPEACDIVAENSLQMSLFASPAVSNGQLFLRLIDEGKTPRQEWLVCLRNKAGT